MKHEIPAQEFVYIDDEKTCSIVGKQIIAELDKWIENGTVFKIAAEVVYNEEGTDEVNIFFDHAKLTDGIFPFLYFIVQACDMDGDRKVVEYMLSKKFIQVPADLKEYLKYLTG